MELWYCEMLCMLCQGDKRVYVVNNSEVHGICRGCAQRLNSQMVACSICQCEVQIDFLRDKQKTKMCEICNERKGQKCNKKHMVCYMCRKNDKCPKCIAIGFSNKDNLGYCAGCHKNNASVIQVCDNRTHTYCNYCLTSQRKCSICTKCADCQQMLECIDCCCKQKFCMQCLEKHKSYCRYDLGSGMKTSQSKSINCITCFKTNIKRGSDCEHDLCEGCFEKNSGCPECKRGTGFAEKYCSLKNTNHSECDHNRTDKDEISANKHQSIKNEADANLKCSIQSCKGSATIICITCKDFNLCIDHAGDHLYMHRKSFTQTEITPLAHLGERYSRIETSLYAKKTALIEKFKEFILESENYLKKALSHIDKLNSQLRKIARTNIHKYTGDDEMAEEFSFEFYVLNEEEMNFNVADNFSKSLMMYQNMQTSFQDIFNIKMIGNMTSNIALSKMKL